MVLCLSETKMNLRMRGAREFLMHCFRVKSLILSSNLMLILEDQSGICIHRTIEYAELEGTHKDLRVQLLAPHRTTPKFGPCD